MATDENRIGIDGGSALLHPANAIHRFDACIASNGWL